MENGIRIIEVKTKKQQKEFIEFPLRLYKGNPFFVPPLYGDEKKLFTDKNTYNLIANPVYENDRKNVGRIQKESNELFKLLQENPKEFEEWLEDLLK